MAFSFTRKPLFRVRIGSLRGCGSRLAVSRADEQLDLHPPGPGREAGQQRPRCPRGSDLGRPRWRPRTFSCSQRPGGTAFVIGEAGLTTALYANGYTLTDRDPDYVVLGETDTYSFEQITKAIRLIVRGARFIATNPDVTGPLPMARCRRQAPSPHSSAGYGRTALLRRKAQPADYALGTQSDRRPFRSGCDDRRSHGHGCRVWARGGYAYGARPDWLHA